MKAFYSKLNIEWTNYTWVNTSNTVVCLYCHQKNMKWLHSSVYSSEHSAAQFSLIMIQLFQYTIQRCDYSTFLWFTFLFPLLDSLDLLSLYASNYIFLSPCQLPPPPPPFFSVCIQLQISLFLSLYNLFSTPLFTSDSISHSFWCTYIAHSLSSFDSKYFCSFPILLLSLFISACLPLGLCPAASLFLSLSVSICLSGHVAFSEGCTLTWWNGVSLFLQRWRHFAVRITTPDIDRGERKRTLGVTESWQGGEVKLQTAADISCRYTSRNTHNSVSAWGECRTLL